MGQFPLHIGVLLMIAIKVNPVAQWGKILVVAMGFVDYLGLGTLMYKSSSQTSTTY